MKRPLGTELDRNLDVLKKMFGDSADFYSKKLEICGIECAIVTFEGISSLQVLSTIALHNLEHRKRIFLSGQKLAKFILSEALIPTEKDPLTDLQEVVRRLTAGTSLIFVDGADFAIAFATQNMSFRAVGKPQGEGNVKGSQEGFTDLLRINVSLVRRLIRTPDLVCEIGQSGKKTNTEYALCYNKKLVSPELLRDVKRKLDAMPLPMVFDSSYFIPFLRKNPFHLFPEMGTTERSAVAAAKIGEGKIVLLVNGSPCALILPYFFAENFQTLDDYSNTALFSSFVRVVKYIAFLIAIFLPGIYVMSVYFTPEILPEKLLHIVAQAEAQTPFPIQLEMLFVVLMFEIIREAGLRMPQQLGHSISLVAALIIGDTAVSAGLMSVPVILVAAMAMVSSYVVPSLYEQTAVLRMLFVLLCGWMGVAGLSLCVIVLVCAVSMQTASYDYLYPLVPPQPDALRDGFWRKDWRILSRHPFAVKEQGDKQE